jgi:hypothetical protein
MAEKKLAPRPGLIKALLPPQQPIPAEKARLWAESTLKKAGLPDKPGWYTLADQGWQGTLVSLVRRLGFDLDTPEHVAASLLEYLHDLELAVKCGDAGAAAKLAFKAGMHWQKHKLDEATKAGLGLVKFRRMGARARKKYDEDTEREWFFDALRIEDETGITSMREQARRIIAAGNGRGASQTTIRDVIADRKARMKKDE